MVARLARHALIAALMAAPALAAAGWLAWSELAPQPGPKAMPFAEALQENYFTEAFEHLRSGRDPNAPVPYSHPRLTGGDELQVTPLLIAVANGRTDTVSMLLSSGVQLDAPGNRFAACLAGRLDHHGIADIIVRDGGRGGEALTCPEAPHREEAPLAVYVE